MAAAAAAVAIVNVWLRFTNLMTNSGRVSSFALTERGWRHKIVPATGYGSDGFVRILARVRFEPPQGLTARPPVAVLPVRLVDADRLPPAEVAV